GGSARGRAGPRAAETGAASPAQLPPRHRPTPTRPTPTPARRWRTVGPSVNQPPPLRSADPTRLITARSVRGGHEGRLAGWWRAVRLASRCAEPLVAPCRPRGMPVLPERSCDSREIANDHEGFSSNKRKILREVKILRDHGREIANDHSERS